MDFPFSHTFFLKIVDQSQVGILILNKELQVVYANESIEKIIGYSALEIVDTRIFERIIKDEKNSKVIQVKLESAFVNPFNDLDVSVIRKKGDVVVVHIIGSPFAMDNHQYLLLFLENITSRKAYEKVMESSFDNFIQTTLDLDAALKKIKEQRSQLEEYQTRMRNELFIANSVQKAILPKTFPRYSNLEIWAASFPSSELGGDYFDFVEIGDKRVGVLLADVSGHGVPSALVTTMLKVIFTNVAARFPEADEFFTHLNQEIAMILEETGFYLTAFYSVINIKEMIVNTACAAHEYGIGYNNQTETLFDIGENSNSTVIGSFKKAEYKSESFDIHPGDRIIFFTDGIVESRNPDGDFFGRDRLKEFLWDNRTVGAKEFVIRLIEELNKFCNSVRAADDRTVVVIDVIGGKAPPEENIDTQAKIDTAYKEGRRYLSEKNYQAATEEFMTVLGCNNRSFGAYSYLGQILSVTGDFAKAEEYFKKAIELNEDYNQGYYYLGLALYKQKKYREAKTYWLKLSERAGEFKHLDVFIRKLKDMGL